jgi:hypothetical protein
MRAPQVLVITALVGAAAAGSPQSATTYDAVRAGMKCRQSEFDARVTGCEYHVGRSLHFEVVAIGEPDSSIYFYSASFEGDYFAVLGLSHGCIVVRPGKAFGPERSLDMAFVSPSNGKVYLTWQECQRRE